MPPIFLFFQHLTGAGTLSWLTATRIDLFDLAVEKKALPFTVQKKTNTRVRDPPLDDLSFEIRAQAFPVSLALTLSLFFLSEFSEVHVQYMVDMLAIRSRT